MIPSNNSIQTVYILTSGVYKCTCLTHPTFINDAFHKVCEMMRLNGCTVYSNSACEMCTTSNESKMMDADWVIALYVNLPVSESCDSISDEPEFKWLNTYRPKKLAYIDYFERSWNNQNNGLPQTMHQWFLDNAHVYFKRELDPKTHFLNVLPYPEPTCRSIPPLVEKKYDVFCSFPQKHTGLRYEAIEVCSKLRETRIEEFDKRIIIKDDCTPEEYIHYATSSWITIDAHGGGQINHRFLELIALRTVVCRQKYTVSFFEDYDSSMILEWETPEDLERVLMVFIGKPELLRVMEQRAHDHYLKHHTAQHVGKYILNVLEESKRS